MKQKLLWLFTIVFALRLLVSCCGLDKDAGIPFALNTIYISHIDNTNHHGMPDIIETDTMLSAAVAFHVTITDSAFNDYFSPLSAFSGFSTVNATSIYLLYKPTVAIEAIRVFTLYDLSESMKADDEVTSHFVALPSGHTLYSTIDEVVSLLHSRRSADHPKVSFSLFCTANIVKPTARFKIEVTLSDQRVLTATTNTLVLLPSKQSSIQP